MGLVLFGQYRVMTYGDRFMIFLCLLDEYVKLGRDASAYPYIESTKTEAD